MKKIVINNGVIGLAPAGDDTLPQSVWRYGDVEQAKEGKADFIGEPATFGCLFSFLRIPESYQAGMFSNRTGNLATDGVAEILGVGAASLIKSVIEDMIRVAAEAEIRRLDEEAKRLTALEAIRFFRVGHHIVEAVQSFEILAISEEQVVVKKIGKFQKLSVRMIEEFVEKYKSKSTFIEGDEIRVSASAFQSKKAPTQTVSEEWLEFKAATAQTVSLGAGWDEAEQEAEPTLSALGAAHATHALASGLSGEITTVAGSRVVIKGATQIKKISTGQIVDEKIEQIQVSFDMKARRLVKEGREFVENNLPQILGLLQEKTPRFVESRVSDDTLRLIASKNRIELPGQINKTLAIIEGLKHSPFVLYNGAPGIGKTHVSFSTVHLYFNMLKEQMGEDAFMRVLFSADGAKHLRKMEREAREVLGRLAIIRIINSKEDIDAIPNDTTPGKIFVYIVSKDTAKRATSFQPVPNLKACPKCGKSFTKKDARERGFASNQGGVCGGCGEKLIFPISKTATTGSFSWGSGEIALPPRAKLSGFPAVESISAYCVRKYNQKLFDLFIVDEAHNMSAEESSQGTMMKEFITVSNKVLLLTGTLTNGYPSSVFHLLSAVMPKRLKEWGFEPSVRGLNRWIDSYGARKTVTRKSRSGQVRVASEKPVISPQMVMHHLAPFTVWGKLEDLNYPMPKYSESVRVTEVEPEILQALERAQLQASHIFMDAGSTRNRSSAITKAMLYVGNNPTKEYTIDVTDKGEVLGTVTIPALFQESYTTLKERALIEEIRNSVENDRKLMVYTFFNVTAETATRLEKVLNREMPNISVGVLPATIKAAKLEEWFEAAANKHQVVIVPYKRVATGLDIPQYPDVVFYEVEYNIRDIMQASKRPYRAVVQKKDVVVKHLVQDGIQATAMGLIASKMTASKIVEGETYSEEGIESFAMDSIELELQKRLADGVAALVRPDFSTTEIAAGRSRPWTKLERRYLEIVKEVNPSALSVIAPEELEDEFVDADISEDTEAKTQGVETIEEVVEAIVEEIFEETHTVLNFDEIEAIDCTTLEPVVFKGVVLAKNKNTSKNQRIVEGDVEEMKNAIKPGEKIQLAFF